MLIGRSCAEAAWRVAVTVISCSALSSAAAAASADGPYKALSTAAVRVVAVPVWYRRRAGFANAA